MAHGQLSKVIRFLRRAAGPEAGTVTDRQLLERFARNREEDAFATLADRHGPMVLDVCRRVLGDAHAAEDAFQATFLVLARKAGAVRWQESVGGWLHEVALRVAQKARGAAARSRSLERQVANVSAVISSTDVDRYELHTVLDQELSRLPDKYRLPLVLCYLEGKTNDEAAQLLGWTKGGVSGQLARARELLRQRLARRGMTVGAAGLVAILMDSAAPAAVPAALRTSTIKAAILGSAAHVAATGAVPASVVILAEGVLQAMYLTRLRMAALILLLLAGFGTGAGMLTYRALAGGAAPTVAAAAPLPEEQPMAAPQPAADKQVHSKPVRLDGVEFEAVADARWLVPAVDKSADVSLALQVTNRSDNEVVLSDTRDVGVRLTTADGKDLAARPLPADAVQKLAPIRLAAGKSVVLSAHARLKWQGDGKALCLEIQPRGGQVVVTDGLLPGKYVVRFTYSNGTKDRVGFVETEPVTIEVVRALAAADKQEVIEVKGKLSIVRTGGPDGRSLTSIRPEKDKPYVLYFGKKGDEMADKLFDAAWALYRKDPEMKMDVIVTGTLRQENEKWGNGVFSGRTFQVRSIKAAEAK
jgi:RNA polymerase sigma factor (sigma-70 family)